MALLIAPLFTAVIAVGGIQNASAGVPEPKTIVVDQDGEVGHSSPRNIAQCDGTRITDGVETSIDEAIGVAVPGDTIIVCPAAAVYEQAVVDVSDITIKGIAQPTVDGGSDPAFKIMANGVVLSGFEAINGDGNCIFVNANDVRIHGNIASGCGGNGIVVNGNSNTIGGNTVNQNGGEGIVIVGTDNTIRGNIVNGNVDGNGIHIDGNDNTIQGNIANGNDGDGIRLSDNSDGNLVKGNTANGNVDNGINVLGDGNTILSNTANNNGDNGIELDDFSSENDVTHNVTNDNFIGILDDGSSNTFDKNRCRNNTDAGSDPTGLCAPQA